MENRMIPFATRIDANTLKNFRILVLKKHGQLYGKLKREIEKALKEHIEKMSKELKEGGENER